ncbi:hypothetical protein GUJ93_ZPchr0001g30564 [Zizania palustris]|uniref:Uncharacterized protein n=1 Tax=Zizania palustris TaxID=103762 RepID=A0A8J5S9U1_ZIZPA|nr:hypothetical protein GUJ93_ZPchr0001g30564 [Zizania palustris]
MADLHLEEDERLLLLMHHQAPFPRPLVVRIHELGDAVEEQYAVKLLRCVSTKFINIYSAMVPLKDINEMVMEKVVGSLKAHEELLKGQ